MRKIKRTPFPYIMRGGADILLLITAAAIIIGLYQCPLYCLTDIPCPGCGMTRACKAAIRLDFKAAFNYNSLFPIPFLWIVYEILTRIFKFQKKVDIIFFSITCSALVIRWVIITFF